MNIKEFQRNAILYAKGHYVQGWSMIKDLQIIAQRTDNSDDLEFIMDQVAHISITAIREAVNPISPLTEYREQMRFLFTNTELIKKYGPTLLDNEEQFNAKLLNMYQESIVASALVIIARWITELDLGDPDPKIMTVRSPKKEKKDG